MNAAYDPEDLNKVWQELDKQGAAGIVGQILQRNAEETDRIQDSLLAQSQATVTRLQREVDYLRPLAERYLTICHLISIGKSNANRYSDE